MMLQLLYEAALLRGCGAVEGNYMPLELIDEVNGCIVVEKEQRFQLIGASLGIRSLVSLRLSSCTGTHRNYYVVQRDFSSAGTGGGTKPCNLKVAHFPSHGLVISSGC